MVSELLGSFGDNELSPECLDGVQRCGILKDTCISVPQNYTAFIAPVSSARLHSEAKAQAGLPLNSCDGPASASNGIQRALETPYVVRSHAASQTHSEQACWTFSHPHPSSGNTSLPRSGEEALSVAIDTAITLHGFLGSFHSVLYESVKSKTGEKVEAVISIAPSSFSTGMFSWFPLYFPLKEPLRVPPGATVNCSIWRQSDNERVWYEWSAEVVSSGTVLSVTSLHNPGGRSYHVRL
eukprot:g11440.t1 g11440   contig5:862896-863991(+)